MNDFDSFLERELRLMLDPVVARVPPVRRERQKPPEAAEPPAVEPPKVDLAETVRVEMALMTVPVDSAPQL